MTHPTDPVAAMREAARCAIDMMICEAPPGPGRDALIAARDVVAVLPLSAAQPDRRRSEAEIRAEIARLTGLIDEPRRKTHFLLLARREAMQWVLNEQDTGR